MFHPATFSRFVLRLLIPKDSVVMSQAGYEIRDPVAVDIFRVNEAGPSQVKLGMKRPLSLSRIPWRFEPALRSDDVGAAIPIHITCSDPMPEALGTDFVLDPWITPVFPREFVPAQSRVWISKLRQNLKRLSGIQDV